MNKEKGLKRNHIYHGDVLELLRRFPAKSINMVVTSPPYWAVRDYGIIGSIWEDPGDCEHWSDEPDLTDWELCMLTRARKKGLVSKLLLDLLRLYLEPRKFIMIDRLRKPSPGDIPGPNSAIAAHRSNNENRPGKPSGFCTECGAWVGNLGLEPYPELFIKHLCDIFDEVHRVLRDDGIIYVNLGDTYGGSGGAGGDWNHGKRKDAPKWRQNPAAVVPKSLVGIPAMFELEMKRRGWIHRNTIIWHKPAPMPSSASDRYTIDFEPMFFFSKSRKYFFVQQFDPLANVDNNPRPFGGNKRAGGQNPTYSGKPYNADHYKHGKIKRTTWSINTASFKGAHFAVYPPELIKTPILSGTPEKVCSKCGEPVVTRFEATTMGKSWHDHSSDLGKGQSQAHGEMSKYYSEGNYKRNLVIESCDCGAPFLPGIVLDPFMGSGTTGMVAKELGRHFVGIDKNKEYIAMAKKRIDVDQRTLLDMGLELV